MTRGGPVHWATIAHPLIEALQPKEPAMTTTDIPPPGTYRQHFTRAHLPDGRIKDSEPVTMATTNPTTVTGMDLAHIKAAFGRWAAPAGTRFEGMERVVTVTVTDWRPVNSEDGTP